VLTADLVRPRLHLRGSELSIDMLEEGDPRWLQSAQDLINLLQEQVGQSQAAWDRALESYVGERVDYVVVRGLAKILTDAATFTPLATPLPPIQLRERLFHYGPVFTSPQLFHQQTRYEVMKNVADEFSISSEQVETALFADRPATYLLSDAGPQWTAEGLLARYNLELARGVLYWASHITIEVSSNYKDLWKFIKLFKLMFWAEPKQGGGYRIDLDGPISPFVSSTLRYGRQLAAFLPALLLCERWQMHAYVHLPQAKGETIYRLDHTCSLRSHFKSSGTFERSL
jgi:predicted nuclease of restriction endonuclease-like RecB superfamily